MEIFDSPWLINMLAKCSQSPQGRLLGLFDILHDWLKAPHVAQADVTLGATNPLLISFCTDQARQLRAENPELLAEHIILIAQNAARHAISQPESNSLLHAQKVALALIQAQTQKPAPTTGIKNSRVALYGMAASMIMMIGAAALWAPALMRQQSPQIITVAQVQETVDTASNENKTLTAIDASRMYAKYEQMRQGTCQFPEVLQIPDKHKSIYLENVVGGKLPTDLEDLSIANFYLEKVRCNFTPMLMAASK